MVEHAHAHQLPDAPPPPDEPPPPEKRSEESDELLEKLLDELDQRSPSQSREESRGPDAGAGFAYLGKKTRKKMNSVIMTNPIRPRAAFRT
jgi:hypothetical protein